MYYIYILLCSDNSFYTGYTNNIKKRLQNHSSNNGSFYLRHRLPFKLVYCKEFDNSKDAKKREKQIKGWSRQKKINLIKFGHPSKHE